MSVSNKLGNQQPNFKNFFESQQGKENFIFLTDACEYNIEEQIYKSFGFFERLGGDRKGARLATKKKRPQYPSGSDWPTIEEQRRIEELVRKYGEHGERTGTRRGKRYFEVWDVDIAHLAQRLPVWLQKQIRTNFELVAKIYRFSYVKTQHGYQVYLLFEELSPNCEIFHRDSWRGIKRNVGSILSKGRQVQGVSSKDKKWVNNGSWFWKLKNIEELAKILKKFFFEVDLKVDNEVKKIISNKNQKVENKKPSFYPKIWIEKARIFAKKIWDKKPNYYRVFYRNSQKIGSFILDAYYRDKKEVIKPNLVGNFLLMKGYKYQFFIGFG